MTNSICEAYQAYMCYMGQATFDIHINHTIGNTTSLSNTHFP